MNEADVKAISIFFFLAFLDDRRALEAANQAVSLFQNKIAANPKAKHSVLIVACTLKIWNKNRGRFLRGRPNYANDSGWILPAKVDFGPWKEFQKSAQEDELLVLIWSKILSFSDDDISIGAEVSAGTLRYRVGKALRKLGFLSVGFRNLNVVGTDG